jgi:NAD(P)-dependent dehydrogenase (short-subunit alcohol dehydrogenase family)
MTVDNTKHAVVTGGGSGIGAAIAQQLTADGFTVTLLGRTTSSLEATAAAIGGDTRTCVCDITDRNAVQRTFAALPPVQVLVNNAGQAESALVSRTSDALWERMLAVNLTGTFSCTRAVLDGMRAAGRGRIVNIASTAGLRGYPYVAAYAAAKHGVIGFTRALALEVAATGITVNAVCPGFTDTDMLARSVANIVAKTGRSAEEARAELSALNPQRRFISPADVAATVSWLCSEGAAAITGQALSVSGGEVM